MVQKTSFLIALLIVFSRVPGGIAQQPVRGGVIGQVVEAKSGEGLKDARVILESRSSRSQREVITNDKGSFVFEDVEPGSYLLHAELTGYIGNRLPVGYARPVPVSVNIEAGRDSSMVLRLVRAANIGGRVYDSNRRPVANAEVEILLPQYSGFGQRMLTRLGIVSPRPDGNPSLRTDDQGEYQFSGIPAGEYYIRAAYPAEPATRRGAVVRANNAAPTYYPGVATAEEAVSIKVAGGDDLRALDFTLLPASSLKVSGRIINPLPRTGPAVYDFYLVLRNAQVRELTQPVPNYNPNEGEFELRDVRPGSYDLYIGFRTGTSPPEFKFYSGRISLDVTDHDLADLAVAIEPGVDIPGQIVPDDAARAVDPGFRKIYPLFSGLDGMPGVLTPTALLGRSAFMKTDGTFVIPNAARGRYFLILGGDPTGYIASARLGTENILGRPFEITNDTTGPLVIEVNGSGGTVQGTVMDKDGAPVPNAQVVLIPPIDFRDDQTAYKAIYSDGRGRFRFSGIRPGNYTAYAITEPVEVRAWMNPEFVTPYLSLGVQVEVSQRQDTERNLRVIKP